MKDQHQFIDRISLEGPLGLGDALRLDQELERQQGVRSLVSAMSDDEPSLAWRSALNQRLAEQAPRRRSPLVRWAPGVFASAAAAVALFVVLGQGGAPRQTPAVAASESSVEELLISSHEDVGHQAAFGLDWASEPPGDSL